MRMMFRLIIILIFPAISIAAHRQGFGGMALDLLSPLSVFSDFMHSACIVIGLSFLFASFIKYLEHRRSPLMVPMSNIVFLLVAGNVLVLLPLLSFIISNGIPYTFLK